MKISCGIIYILIIFVVMVAASKRLPEDLTKITFLKPPERLKVRVQVRVDPSLTAPSLRAVKLNGKEDNRLMKLTTAKTVNGSEVSVRLVTNGQKTTKKKTTTKKRTTTKKKSRTTTRNRSSDSTTSVNSEDTIESRAIEEEVSNSEENRSSSSTGSSGSSGGSSSSSGGSSTGSRSSSTLTSGRKGSSSGKGSSSTTNKRSSSGGSSSGSSGGSSSSSSGSNSRSTTSRGGSSTSSSDDSSSESQRPNLMMWTLLLGMMYSLFTGKNKTSFVLTLLGLSLIFAQVQAQQQPIEPPDVVLEFEIPSGYSVKDHFLPFDFELITDSELIIVREEDIPILTTTSVSTSNFFSTQIGDPDNTDSTLPSSNLDVSSSTPFQLSTSIYASTENEIPPTNPFEATASVNSASASNTPSIIQKLFNTDSGESTVQINPPPSSIESVNINTTEIVNSSLFIPSIPLTKDSNILTPPTTGNSLKETTENVLPLSNPVSVSSIGAETSSSTPILARASSIQSESIDVTKNVSTLVNPAATTKNDLSSITNVTLLRTKLSPRPPPPVDVPPPPPPPVVPVPPPPVILPPPPVDPPIPPVAPPVPPIGPPAPVPPPPVAPPVPPVGPPPHPLPDSCFPVFADDFSSIDGSWTLDSDWQIGPAITSNCSNGCNDPATDNTGQGDNGLLGYKIGGCFSRNDFGKPTSYATSPIVNQISLFRFFGFRIILEFTRIYSFDEFYFLSATVEVFDGTFWRIIDVNERKTCTPRWTYNRYDVTPFINPNFRVRFSLRVTSDRVYEMGGWSIDDFALYACGAPR